MKKKRDDYESSKALYSDEIKKIKEDEIKIEEEKLVNTLKMYQVNIKEKEQELIKRVIDRVR